MKVYNTILNHPVDGYLFVGFFRFKEEAELAVHRLIDEDILLKNAERIIVPIDSQGKIGDFSEKIKRKYSL